MELWYGLTVSLRNIWGFEDLTRFFKWWNTVRFWFFFLASKEQRKELEVSPGIQQESSRKTLGWSWSGAQHGGDWPIFMAGWRLKTTIDFDDLPWDTHFDAPVLRWISQHQDTWKKFKGSTGVMMIKRITGRHCPALWSHAPAYSSAPHRPEANMLHNARPRLWNPLELWNWMVLSSFEIDIHSRCKMTMAHNPWDSHRLS